MSLHQNLEAIRDRMISQADLITTEETTKNALVLPFLQSLGYDVFNPSEVTAEYTADTGTKKGEKVDYVIMSGGKPAILIECKSASTKLNDNHSSQLFRYFATTDACVAILTNGHEYRFYADLEKQNKMDERPFFQFSLTALNDHDIKEIDKFRRENFDAEKVIRSAGRLKYLGLIKAYLAAQLNEPDEEFVRQVVKSVYQGKLTAQVLEQLTPVTKAAIDQVVREKFKARLENALSDSSESTTADNGSDTDIDDSGIITTEDEILGYNIVCAISAAEADVSRVVMRDAKSYCSILFDDNNRKPIVRLRFNTKQLRIGIFAGKDETVHDINTPADIYTYAAAIRAQIKGYAAG